MPTQCAVPYYSLEINGRSSGTFCCKMDQRSRLDIAVTEFTSPEVNALRDQLMQGPELDEICRACARPQNQGQEWLDSTRRTRKTQQYQQLGWMVQDPQPQLRDLHMALDNVCASSCMACSPNLSSTIDLLTRDMTPTERSQHFGRAGHLRTRAYKSIDLAALEPHFKDLELVQIYGGEPLISPLWPQMMEVLSRSPGLRKLSVTTGMKQIKQRWFQAMVDLPSNVELELVISCDAPLDMNHWIRGCTEQEFMSAWQIIEPLRERFQHILIQPVIANYNVWALPDLVKFVAETLGPHMIVSSPVWEPRELHAGQLPDAVKTATINKISAADHSTANQVWWLKRLYKTALDLCREPQTESWDRSLERMQLLPALRGDTRTIDHWLERYL